MTLPVCIPGLALRMVETFTNPFYTFCMGLGLGAVFLIMAVISHWKTKGEFRRYKTHLSDKLELEARQMQDTNKEKARLAAENESLRVQVARLNLGHATVTAPIGGRIGRALVTEGALVSAAEATPLAVIQQMDSVYVNFTQPGGETLRLQRALAAGRLQKNADALVVRVVLEDGGELPRAGRLLFSDVAVDATTGQVTLRAEVPNPQGLLLPGQYVRVRLAPATLPSAVLLPQQAVTRTAQGDTVLVVGPDDKPVVRPVQIAGGQDGQWVVTGGLQAGEKVIVDGFQKMFAPGAPVKPVPWAPRAASPAGGAASAPVSAASR